MIVQFLTLIDIYPSIFQEAFTSCTKTDPHKALLALLLIFNLIGRVLLAFNTAQILVKSIVGAYAIASVDVTDPLSTDFASVDQSYLHRDKHVRLF